MSSIKLALFKAISAWFEKCFNTKREVTAAFTLDEDG